ncbi:unnamed protein product, partial [Ixodes pacificus]
MRSFGAYDEHKLSKQIASSAHKCEGATVRDTSFNLRSRRTLHAATTTCTAISAVGTARCGVVGALGKMSARSVLSAPFFFFPAPWARRNPRSHSPRPCPKKRRRYIPPASVEAKYSASSENNET